MTNELDEIISKEILRKLTPLMQSAILGKSSKDQQDIAKIGLQWVNLLLGKNSDYGSTIFKAPRLRPALSPTDCVLIRMSDKIDRLTNLALNGKQEINESFDDTIRDLGAYCLLYLIAKSREEDINGDET